MSPPIEKLRKLLAMTEQNGASEAEALRAAELAGRLMTEHNLSIKSVEEIDTLYHQDARPFFRPSSAKRRSAPKPPITVCLAVISDLCSVEHFYQPKTGNLTFFGPKHGTETAHYLVVILSRAIEREWREYRQGLDRNTARRARASFLRGIAYKIGARLARMKDENKAISSSNALVVVADEHLKSTFQKKFKKIAPTPKGKKPANPAALVDGWEAGDRVPINPAISTAKASGIITGD